jgi:hypothetical protein
LKRLVVRRHNPRRVVIAFGLLFVTAVASGWGLFEYGRSRSGPDFGSLREENRRLSVENESLQGAIAKSREKLAVLDRTQQIEREAYKQLETTVAGLQGELLVLKKDLAFYRSIVAPTGSKGSLQIQAFEVAKNGLERGYRYKLVLTQEMKNDSVARGRVDVSIEGSSNERITVLRLGDLDPKSANLDFRFKYFQNFEGDFQVPAGFSPSRVLVKVTPGDGSSEAVEKAFNWPT